MKVEVVGSEVLAYYHIVSLSVLTANQQMTS